MLRAVDIASHQAGIDVSSLDCDIVIVKVTGGTYHENPYWREWADAVLASGKLLGLYHYARDLNGDWMPPDAEAHYFLDRAGDYAGRFVPILDWEKEAYAYDAGWIGEWLDIVARETGSTPMFYAGGEDVKNRDFSGITMYPLWLASYLFRYQGAGWIDDPDCIYGPGDWDWITMYQYTSTGDIWGYDGDLDLSVFYGDSDDWKRLQGGKMGSIEKMVQHAIDIANDDSHGYSWADRWDIDRDCSSLMYDSADAGGYPVGRGPDKTRYTGTMPQDFANAGFEFLEYGAVEPFRGCIFLRDPWGAGGHTEMYIGNGMTVGAHIAETGGVYGEPGDQTGYEISITPDPGGWDYILVPRENGDDMSARDVWEYGITSFKGIVMSAGERLVDIQQKFYDETDYSGRDKKANFIVRICHMAKKQEEQGKQLDNIEAMLKKLTEAGGDDKR